ncbi:MAG: phosphoenolpyruvate kinase, partial [Polyangiaceae bacterium]
MTTKTSLAESALGQVRTRLKDANLAFAARYPGERSVRQPVHTVYGGAHLFRHDAAPHLGALAIASLEVHAPDAASFAKAFNLPAAQADTIYTRVLEKLRREPVEDYRIDFEDGYGNRPDAEEDGHAISAAREVA